MTGADRLRDSTQIQLPDGTLDGVRAEIEERFAVTVRDEEGDVRIIGSPVAIKKVSDFLARNGIAVA